MWVLRDEETAGVVLELGRQLVLMEQPVDPEGRGPADSLRPAQGLPIFAGVRQGHVEDDVCSARQVYTGSVLSGVEHEDPDVAPVETGHGLDYPGTAREELVCDGTLFEYAREMVKSSVKVAEDDRAPICVLPEDVHDNILFQNERPVLVSVRIDANQEL